MGKLRSSLSTALSRLLKIVMVVVIIPLAVSLIEAVLDQLELSTMSGATFRQWITWGFVSYVGLHLLLYRPAPLFRASHRLFSAIAVWLFGGQVSSVEGSGGGKGKGAKGGKGEGVAEGSTLVAFSPYVIPSYTIFAATLAWVASRWVDRSLVDGPAAFLIGVTIAFHWLMTADDLQQQRSRWHVETYLLAIGLVFVVTLLIGGACITWAIPEFSFLRSLVDGLSRAQAFYTTLIQQLFL
jgi:hypothetical protein